MRDQQKEKEAAIAAGAAAIGAGVGYAAVEITVWRHSKRIERGSETWPKGFGYGVNNVGAEIQNLIHVDRTRSRRLASPPNITTRHIVLANSRPWRNE